MAEVGSIVINARMYTSDFLRGGKQVGEELGRIGSLFKGAQHSVREFAKSLSTGAGFNRQLKDIADTFRGGAQVAGVALAGRALREAAEASARIATNLRTGAVSMKEAAEDLVGSAPVIGDFWKAGRGIREVITGEGAEAQLLLNSANAEMARVEKRGQAIRALLEAQADFDRQQIEKQRAQQIAAAGAFWGEWISQSFKARDAVDKINQKFDAIIKDNPNLSDKANGERSREVDQAWEDLRGARIQAVRDSLKSAFNTVSAAAAGAFGFFVDGIEKKVEDRLKSNKGILDDLKERVEALGLDEKGLALRQLQRNGATPDEIQQASDAFDRLDAYQKVKQRIDELRRGLDAPPDEIRLPQGRERRFTFASPSAPPNIRDPIRDRNEKQISLLQQILDAIKNNDGGVIIPTLSLD
jgi:hypothetical protein